ncbi:MFS transporter [Kribbella capetownensis]|uniref:MFS transporter n=1 Tax=Kribbella capetownensis TaxID=1572659 RepID=A0A4R0J0C6_9ACTN|nr:MFS transporter [Kribbella capetownensis]TCC37398.1 MFS transporter [Kribbella capetownensis]
MYESRRWAMLPVVLAGMFMYGFDLNVVNVAVPSLQHDLHAGQAALELVVGGYAFTYAAGLMTGGRLGDLVGYRTMFLLGMAGFTLASTLCGLAQTPSQLVGARLIQGLTAAGMVPQILSLITVGFPSDERSRALAWFGITGAVSGVFGQVLGGILLVVNVFGLGWRAVFFLNLPIGLLVLAFAARLLPRTTTERHRSLDLLGLIGITGSLALAQAPLVLGRQEGWPLWSWVLLAGSVPAVLLTLSYERRLAQRGGNPLLDLALFASRTFSSGLCISIAFMANFASSIFVFSMLLQNGLGLTASQAGLSFLPMALLGTVAPMFGKRLILTHGAPTVILAGCVIDGVADVLLALALHIHGASITVPWLVIGLGLMGLGNTLVLPALIGATLAGIRPTQAGIASGTLNTVQQFAGSAGLAVIGTIFFAVLSAAPTTSQYAHAAETATWIGLGLVIIMASLTVLFLRGSATPGVPTTSDASTRRSEDGVKM